MDSDGGEVDGTARTTAWLGTAASGGRRGGGGGEEGDDARAIESTGELGEIGKKREGRAVMLK